jgi:hypothetical protein
MHSAVAGRKVIQGYFPRGVRPGRLPDSFGVSRAPGQPLPPAVRQKMESVFGTSFAEVRVHVDNSPLSIGALAFTHGTSIHVAPGHYAPHTTRGQEILAHELAHVVQQRAGRARGTPGTALTVVHDPLLEAEAQRMVTRVSQPAPSPRPGAPVQRQVAARQTWPPAGVAQPVGWGELSMWVVALPLTTGFRLVAYRLPRLIGTILQSAYLFDWFYRAICATLRGGGRALLPVLRQGVIGTGGWLFRLLAAIVDTLGVTEGIEFVQLLLRAGCRRLTPAEITEAQRVYGNSISYGWVYVDDTNMTISDIYGRLAGGGFIGVTVFHTIEIDPTYGTSLLIHELGHVRQHEAVGSRYMAEAIYHGNWLGYDYDATDVQNNHLRQFNREQQCRIAEHYYAMLTNPLSLAAANGRCQGLNIALNHVGIRGVVPGLTEALAGTPLPMGVTQGGIITALLAIYQPRIQEFERGEV